MSGYLELAKKVVGETPYQPPESVLAKRSTRRLEEADRRGFVARRSREPGWISLHDPTTGEWHDFPARDCLPSIVEEVSGKIRKGGSGVTLENRPGTREHVQDGRGRGEEGCVSTGGRVRPSRRHPGALGGSRWGVLLGGLGVGLAIGFVLGAVAEVMVTPGGWEAVSEDLLHPLAFLLAVVGALSGGFLLLAAEHGGNQQRAWRAAAVFVASAVLAALLFWGAL